MDVQLLYEQFLRWNEACIGPFPYGDVLFKDGVVVLAPNEHPDWAIKIITQNSRPDIPSVAKEFFTIERLQKLGLREDLFAIPQPIAFGSRPDHVIMTHMGKGFGRRTDYNDVVARVGKATGAFAAQLCELDGSAHNDLHWGNLTQMDDGRIGIIDMAAIEPLAEIERMFRTPLIQYGCLAGHMAMEFTRLTGYAIDPDRVQELSSEKEWPLIHALKGQRPEFAEMAEQNCAANLKEWKSMLSNGSPVRPIAKTVQSTPNL